jgi:hypothetical protein
MGESKESQLGLIEQKFQELIISDDGEMRNLAMSLVASFSDSEVMDLMIKSGFTKVQSSYSGTTVEMIEKDMSIYKFDLEKREIFKLELMGGYSNVFIKDPSKYFKLMPRKSINRNDDATTI